MIKIIALLISAAFIGCKITPIPQQALVESAKVKVVIQNQAELLSALSKAKPGDIITATGVNLGKVKLANKTYAVTIQGGTYQEVQLSAVNGLKFIGATFDAVSILKEPFYVEGATGIEFHNSTFKGKVVAGLGTGTGLRIVRSTKVVVNENVFNDFYTSFHIGGSDGVIVSKNQFLNGAYDTIHFGSSNANVLIEDNKILAKPSNLVKHVDLLQVINMGGGTPTHDVVIRNNDFRAVNGVGIHGIYFGNWDAQQEGANTVKESYSNIVIEGNHIETTQMAAIAVSFAKNISIKNNQAIRPAGTGSGSKVASKPTILVETSNQNVTITGNLTSTPIRAGHLIGGWTKDKTIPSTWTVNNNTLAK